MTGPRTETGLDLLEGDLQAGMDTTDPTYLRDNLILLGGMGKLHSTTKIV